MQKLFLVTVDCDLRCNEVSAQQKSLDTLLQVFVETGVAGHNTWFLNENDFAITENHESFLIEALKRGDTIGIHDHFEPFKGVYETESIKDFCRQSKNSVVEWLDRNGYKKNITIHRNGCLVQNEAVYTVLKDLGYTTLSDILAGKSFPDRYGYPAFDNRSIPAGINPYRHDEANFDDYTSTEGHFLQIPLMQMGIQFFDFNIMDRWIEAFTRKSVDTGVFAWIFHPYEIMNLEVYDDRTTVSPNFVNMLRSHLERLVSEYGVTFVSMEEVIKRINMGILRQKDKV